MFSEEEKRILLNHTDELKSLRSSINVLISQVKESNENLKKVIKDE